MVNIKKRLKRNKILYFNFLVLLLFSNCSSFYQIVNDYYPSEDIYIENYYQRNCVDVTIIYAECNTLYEDSLFNLFKNELNKLELKVIYENEIINLYDDSLWLMKKHYPGNNVSKLDTNLIKKNIKYKERLTLVPIINYFETYIFNRANINFKIGITLSIFLVKNDIIIYASNQVVRDGDTFIGRVEDLDKSIIDIEKMWREIVLKSLQPYIERLK
ncbi:MAG: hypothetical protein JJT77_11295 [Crocinitomicaceae bacterium]|nr:hypothetical protein [Crocinitomicaceae bacterium]